MISLMIGVCFCWNFFGRALPMINVDQRSISHENSTINTKINRNQHRFDINSYRSSWKFIDKHTIRVRFRLDESLLQSIESTRFVVRHLHTNDIRIYDKPSETINSTLTLYLRDMKHGRHIVCLQLYRSKLMLNPRHVFCQDIINNYQKYGHHDMDLDEHRNTFFFLLTQYSIVIGILCVFQIVHTARKRRFLKSLYEKANMLRHLMVEHSHHRHPQENKFPSTNIDPHTHALEYLIYNLNRNALHNLDQLCGQTTNEDSLDNTPILNRPQTQHERYLKIPDPFSKDLFEHPQLFATAESDDDIFDESDFDTRSYEEQSLSYKSVSHILEVNKPWMAKLTDNGTVQHLILPSENSVQV